jgi:hypothetical protein
MNKGLVGGRRGGEESGGEEREREKGAYRRWSVAAIDLIGALAWFVSFKPRR